jgi:hypothetical protein
MCAAMQKQLCTDSDGVCLLLSGLCHLRCVQHRLACAACLSVCCAMRAVWCGDHLATTHGAMCARDTVCSALVLSMYRLVTVRDVAAGLCTRSCRELR